MYKDQWCDEDDYIRAIDCLIYMDFFTLGEILDFILGLLLPGKDSEKAKAAR